MKKGEIILISFLSVLVLIAMNEFYYLLNFSPLSFGKIHSFIDRYEIALLLSGGVLFVVEVIVGLTMRSLIAKFDRMRYYFVTSLIVFVIINFYLRQMWQDFYLMNLQSEVCLLSSIILATYLFFYSIYYGNAIKYSR